MRRICALKKTRPAATGRRRALPGDERQWRRGEGGGEGMAAAVSRVPPESPHGETTRGVFLCVTPIVNIMTLNGVICNRSSFRGFSNVQFHYHKKWRQPSQKKKKWQQQTTRKTKTHFGIRNLLQRSKTNK
jgi:hypothetical protein